MAEPCHLDRFPIDVLRDILHRAAVRLDCKDAAVWALGKQWSSTNFKEQWAQVMELCRLQGVCKRCYRVAATVKNLRCRISPLKAKAEISGLAIFLSKARCAEGLAITIGPETLRKDHEDEGGYRHPETQATLFRALAESQSFRELFVQAPCLERFAVVIERSTQYKEELDQEMKLKLAADIEGC